MIIGQIRRSHLRGQYTTLNCHDSYTNAEYDMKLSKTSLSKFNLIKYNIWLIRIYLQAIWTIDKNFEFLNPIIQYFGLYRVIVFTCFYCNRFQNEIGKVKDTSFYSSKWLYNNYSRSCQLTWRVFSFLNCGIMIYRNSILSMICNELAFFIFE